MLNAVNAVNGVNGVSGKLRFSDFLVCCTCEAQAFCAMELGALVGKADGDQTKMVGPGTWLRC